MIIHEYVFFPPPSLPLFLSLFLCFFLSGVLRVCLYLPAQSKEKISGEICRVNCSGWEGRRRRGRRGVLVSRWWMEIVLKEARATESDSFLSFSLIFSLLLLLLLSLFLFFTPKRINADMSSLSVVKDDQINALLHRSHGPLTIKIKWWKPLRFI